jgi:hypothetical protein
MEVQRVKSVRQSGRGGMFSCLGCIVVVAGCGLVTALAAVAGLVIFRDQLVGVGMQAAGFESEGRTDAIFSESAAAMPAIPDFVEPIAPQTFTVGAAGIGQETVTNNQGATLVVGNSAEGQVATVTTSERQLLDLCEQWSTLCSEQGITESGVTVRNASVDLRPGGAILRADIRSDALPTQQRVGLVMQVEGTRVVVRGVDLNGFLYSSPPPELATLVVQAENEVNNAIQRLTVNALGASYTLDRIAIDEESLTVVLK